MRGQTANRPGEGRGGGCNEGLHQMKTSEWSIWGWGGGTRDSNVNLYLAGARRRLRSFLENNLRFLPLGGGHAGAVLPLWDILINLRGARRILIIGLRLGSLLLLVTSHECALQDAGLNQLSTPMNLGMSERLATPLRHSYGTTECSGMSDLQSTP